MSFHSFLHSSYYKTMQAAFYLYSRPKADLMCRSILVLPGNQPGRCTIAGHSGQHLIADIPMQNLILFSSN
jgi:hypothetical protein